jgi:hypothetical protein
MWQRHKLRVKCSKQLGNAQTIKVLLITLFAIYTPRLSPMLREIYLALFLHFVNKIQSLLPQGIWDIAAYRQRSEFLNLAGQEDNLDCITCIVQLCGVNPEELLVGIEAGFCFRVYETSNLLLHIVVRSKNKLSLTSVHVARMPSQALNLAAWPRQSIPAITALQMSSIGPDIIATTFRTTDR